MKTPFPLDTHCRTSSCCGSVANASTVSLALSTSCCCSVEASRGAGLIVAVKTAAIIPITAIQGSR